mgnify:CR=1 FL=1|jgi:hypothetical protein|nr:MAG TPA: hypothetical protein [Caudoviricetes sp.]
MTEWLIKIYDDGEKTHLDGFADIGFLERARELITQTIEKYKTEENKHDDKRTIH